MRLWHVMAQGGLGAVVVAAPLLLGCPQEEIPPHERLRIDATEITLEGDRIHVVVRIDRGALSALRWGTLFAGSSTAGSLAVIPDSPDHVGASAGRSPDAASVDAAVEWLPVIGADCDAVVCEYGATIIVTELEPVAASVVTVGVRAETPSNVDVSPGTRLELLADGGEPLLAVVEEVR